MDILRNLLNAPAGEPEQLEHKFYLPDCWVQVHVRAKSPEDAARKIGKYLCGDNSARFIGPIAPDIEAVLLRVQDIDTVDYVDEDNTTDQMTPQIHAAMLEGMEETTRQVLAGLRRPDQGDRPAPDREAARRKPNGRRRKPNGRRSKPLRPRGRRPKRQPPRSKRSGRRI
jgi:hypothetical protein